MPVFEGLTGIITPVPGVAHHAAQQANVGPAQEFTIPILDLAQAFDIKLEFICGGHAVGHGAIQAMKAVEQKNLILFEFQWIGLDFPLSGFEIVSGHLNRFALEKLCEMTIDEFQIQSLGSFKIVITKFIFWMKF